MSIENNTAELEAIALIAEQIEVPNIQSISVNHVAQAPDENKNVNIEVPTAPIQAITVDGVEQVPDEDGVVNLELGIPEGVATESYVDEKIGEIGEVLDSINADLSAI